VAALSAVVRAAYLYVYAASDPLYDHLLHDARRYHEWASALALGNPWEAGPFHQAPLYPYLVALVYALAGTRPLAVYGIQLLCGLATILLVWRIGSFVRDRRAGLVAASLAALYGPFLFYETRLLPATLVVFLSAVAVERLLAADRSSRNLLWLVAGIVLGLSAIASPGSLLLLLLAIPWTLGDRARARPLRARRAGLLLAGAALVIVPVTVRNAWVGEEAVLISTNGGITFYQGNNPVAGGVFSAPEGFSGSVFTQRQESRALAERETGTPLTDSEVSRFWLRKGVAFLASEPGRAARLVGRKLAFALDDYEQPLEYAPSLDPNPIRFLVPLPFAVLLGLAAIRLFPSVGRLSRGESLLVLALAAQVLVLLLFYVSSRYRLPAVPALAVLAGSGAVLAWDRLREAGRRMVVPLLSGAALSLFSFFFMPLADPGHYRSVEAMALCDRAGACFAAKRLDEAISGYREAIRLDPTYAFAHLDLAHALDARGDRAEAEREMREAVRLAPGVAEAHLALGVHLYEEGRLVEAADRFAEAFRLGPTADTGNNLIGTCLKLGRLAEALAAWRAMKTRGLPVDPQLESWIRESEGAGGGTGP